MTAFPDGTSNTIAFSETYADCNGSGKIWTESNSQQGSCDFQGSWFGSANSQWPLPPIQPDRGRM